MMRACNYNAPDRRLARLAIKTLLLNLPRRLRTLPLAVTRSSRHPQWSCAAILVYGPRSFYFFMKIVTFQKTAASSLSRSLVLVSPAAAAFLSIIERPAGLASVSRLVIRSRRASICRLVNQLLSVIMCHSVSYNLLISVFRFIICS